MSVTRTATLAKDVQDAAYAFLSARAELAGVPGVARRKGNIVNDIAAAVQKLGVCYYVFPALPVALNSNNPGPYVDELMVRIRAIEHPTLNRTGPDCYELVELLVRLLDNRQLTLAGGAVLNPLRWPPSPIQVVNESDLLVQYDVVAFTSHGLDPIQD